MLKCPSKPHLGPEDPPFGNLETCSFQKSFSNLFMVSALLELILESAKLMRNVHHHVGAWTRLLLVDCWSMDQRSCARPCLSPSSAWSRCCLDNSTFSFCVSSEALLLPGRPSNVLDGSEGRYHALSTKPQHIHRETSVCMATL